MGEGWRQAVVEIQSLGKRWSTMGGRLDVLQAAAEPVMGHRRGRRSAAGQPSSPRIVRPWPPSRRQIEVSHCDRHRNSAVLGPHQAPRSPTLSALLGALPAPSTSQRHQWRAVRVPEAPPWLLPSSSTRKMPPPTASAAARPADNAQFLRKQRTAVEAIAADNAKLKEELVLENKFSVNPTTQTAAALIGNLQAQADVYAAKVCVRGGGLGG